MRHVPLSTRQGAKLRRKERGAGQGLLVTLVVIRKSDWPCAAMERERGKRTSLPEAELVGINLWWVETHPTGFTSSWFDRLTTNGERP